MGLGVRSLRVRRQEIGVRRQEIILFILPTPHTLFQVSPDAKVGTAKDENIGIIFPK
ncbi:MAG: hypothetical protein ACKPH4_07970 [Microcystis panniformis]